MVGCHITFLIFYILPIYIGCSHFQVWTRIIRASNNDSPFINGLVLHRAVYQSAQFAVEYFIDAEGGQT